MMLAGTRILLLVAFMIGLQNSALSMNQFGTAKCDDGSGNHFFPDEIRPRLGSWYDSRLKALGEMPLCKIRGASEIYRFIWLRTFHKPIAIRVEKGMDRIRLFVKQTDGAGGYDPGTLELNRQTTLLNVQWEIFQQRLKAAGFGKQPPIDQRIGLDGARWILEGVKDRHYYVDDRWSPDTNVEHAKFREACLYLLELSGLRIEPKELY